MVYVTGDTHGGGDIESIVSVQERINLFTESDTLIIAGDFGALWNNVPDEHERSMLKFYRHLPCQILFIDGNHENHDRLDALPTVEKYGADVGEVDEGVHHLRRGRVYTIEEKKIFTFGGGYSLDIEFREPGISWWPQELPSDEDYKRGMTSLEKVGNVVDAIITHTCSMSMFHEIQARYGFSMAHKDNKEEEPLRKYLENIYRIAGFSKWYFGHFHIDMAVTDKVDAVYNDILEV